MASVDKKVVRLELQNESFEANAKKTQTTLDQLKKKLAFGDVDKGMKNVSNGIKGLDFSPASGSVDTFSARISTMQAVAIGALINIGNKITDMAVKLGKQTFLDPITNGFSEYELKLNSIQTILANTKQKGENLDSVTAVLNDLNRYADQTIYNFAQMTQNIGRFTAAGVGLNDSAAAIKGMSNLAALFGANSQQASSAMYQLSQALSSGTVRLMDWNSIQNSSMDGEQFKNALIEVARVHGTFVDEAIAKQGSFRDSLQEGWLTSEVMIETLTMLTGDLTKEQIMSMGYSEQQADMLYELGQTAMKSATEVKTFTGMMEALKEAAASGWAETWEILFGNFDQAKELWTGVNDVLSGFMNSMSEARNSWLQAFVDLGGRSEIIGLLGDLFTALGSAIAPIGRALGAVFKPLDPAVVVGFIQTLRKLVQFFTLSETSVENLTKIFEGLFSVVKMVAMPFGALIRVVGELIDALFSKVPSSDTGILGFLAGAASAVTNFVNSAESADVFYNALKKVVAVIGEFAGRAREAFAPILEDASAAFASAGDALKSFFTKSTEAASGGYEKAAASVSGFVGVVSATVSGAIDKIVEFGNKVKETLGKVGEWFDGLGNKVAPAKDKVSEGMSKISSEMKLDPKLLTGGAIAGFTAMLVVAFKRVMDILKGPGDIMKEVAGMIKSLGGAFEGLSGSLNAFTTSIKVDSLFKVSAALAILAVTLIALSFVPADRIAKGLGLLAASLLILVTSVKTLSNIADNENFNARGLITVSAAMVIVAIAVGIMALALLKVQDIQFGEIEAGMLALGAGLAGLTLSVKRLGGLGPSTLAAAAAMVILALAMYAFAGAIRIMGNIEMGELVKGILSLTIVLAALGVFLAKSGIEKTAFRQSAAMIALGAGILVLALSVMAFGNMDIGTLAKGIGGVSVLLLALGVMIKVGQGGQLDKMGIAMFGVAAAMKAIAKVVTIFAGMSLGEIAKSLIAIGLSLAMMMAVLNASKGVTAGSGVAFVMAAAGLYVVVESVKKLAEIPLGTLTKGLIALGGAMLIAVLACNLMTGALPGAVAITVFAFALGLLAPPLMLLGSMSLAAIVTALVAMAGSFIVLGAVTVVLAPVIPLIVALAAAIALLGVGTALAGLGVMALASGLTMLAALGPAAIGLVTAAILSIAATIPVVAASLALGLVSFIQIIAENTPAMIDAFSKILIGIIDAIIAASPKIYELFQTLLGLACQALIEGVPRLADAGLKMLLGILQAIASNMYQIVTAATDIIVNFLNGLRDGIPRIIDAGFEMIKAVAKGIMDKIASVFQPVFTQMKDVGRNMVEGIKNGLANIGSAVWNMVKNAGQNALDGIKGLFGIQSPSRVMKYIGKMIQLGWALGLEENSGLPVESAQNGANSVLQAYQDALNNGLNFDALQAEFSPTITPVLDLTEVRKGLAALDAATQPIAAPALPTLPRDVVTSSNSRDEQFAETRAGGINITNNIYSPEPVDSYDVYRQTRSAVAQLRREYVDDTNPNRYRG